LRAASVLWSSVLRVLKLESTLSTAALTTVSSSVLNCVLLSEMSFVSRACSVFPDSSRAPNFWTKSRFSASSPPSNSALKLVRAVLSFSIAALRSATSFEVASAFRSRASSSVAVFLAATEDSERLFSACCATARLAVVRCSLSLAAAATFSASACFVRISSSVLSH
jgi:hypothetical protein